MTSLNRNEYIKAIIENLRCPLDWKGRSEEGIFLEKWYYTVSDNLPNGESDAASLKSDDVFLSAPDEEFFSDEFYDDQEIYALYVNTKKDIIHKVNGKKLLSTMH